jgi:hypothetical protein
MGLAEPQSDLGPYRLFLSSFFSSLIRLSFFFRKERKIYYFSLNRVEGMRGMEVVEAICWVIFYKGKYKHNPPQPSTSS